MKMKPKTPQFQYKRIRKHQTLAKHDNLKYNTQDIYLKNQNTEINISSE